MPVSQTLEEVKRQHLVGSQPNAAVDSVAKVRQGEMPSNAQLREVIKRTEGTLEQRKLDPNLTPRGEQVIVHAEQFLQASEQVLDQRNKDEHLQHIINMNAGRATTSMPSADAVSSTLRSLGSSVIMMARSGEFRNNLIELINVLDDIFKIQQGDSPFQAAGAAIKGTSSGSQIKQQVKQAATTTKKLLDPDNPAQLTDAQTEELFNRLSAVMSVLSSHPDYKQAVLSLFKMVDTLKDRAMTSASEDRNMTPEQLRIREEAKQTVQSFTGNHSIDPFLNSARALIRRVSRDVYMRELFHDLRSWLDDVLSLPTLLQRKEYRSSGQDLIRRAKMYSRDYEYDRDYQQLIKEARILLDEIKHDEVINQLQESGALLLSDFTTEGPNHKRVLDLAALTEMKDIIAPILIDQLEHVPVPRIEGSDETYDYVIDNIVFSARDILPENISITTKTTSKIGVEGAGHAAQGVVKVGIKAITTHIPNVKFFFKRKSFPRISDEGTVDVDVRGKGASLKIWLYMDKVSTVPQFSAHSVQFILRGFDLHFRRDTKHTFLLNMGTKIFRAPLEKRIEAAVTLRIEHVMDFISLRLNQYLNRGSVKVQQVLRGTPMSSSLAAAIPISRGQATAGTSAKTPTTAKTTTAAAREAEGDKIHKTLEDMGYVPGTPGGAAMLAEDVWQGKLLVLKRMGYKAGSPGGFAVPLDGDLYKWARDVPVKQHGVAKYKNRQWGINAPKLATLRRMGYCAGTPGGLAAPMEGDIYQYSADRVEDTTSIDSTPAQQYIFGGRTTMPKDQTAERSQQVPGISQAPAEGMTGTHLAARDWQGDKEPKGDFFKTKESKWEDMPGGLTSSTGKPNLMDEIRQSSFSQKKSDSPMRSE
jgi:hypothetical protein